jgi:CIC family chloride channel protein
MAIIVGILSGLAAVVLKQSVHFIQNFLHSTFKDYDNTYFFLIYPVVGILLSATYIQVFRKGDLGRGFGNVIIETTKKRGVVAKHKMYSQLISSVLTLGFGGSAGLEAPISVTGAAIGSNTAIALKIGERERKVLLGCGAAGGIAAIFNSPIAGVLFAIEIILSELTIPTFIPILISSATATVVSKVLYSGQPFKLITESWEISAIPYYILLGIVSGLICIYISKVYHDFHVIYDKWEKPYLKALTGGLIVGLMLFIMPPLYGEGYHIVEFLLNGDYLRLLDNSLFWQFKDSIWFLIIYAFVIMMLKVVATSVTINSGGNGGMFGSSLFVGALLGFVYAKIINVTGISQVTEVNFIVVAMAGILAGVVHSPLTAIFLIAEITGGYVLFIPLMIVVSLSYFITIHFEPYSIYTKGIAEKGEFILYNRDRLILDNLSITKMIETNFIPLYQEDPLAKLIEAIEQSNRNVFPILDDKNNLVGIVLLDAVREIIFNRHMYQLVLMRDIMDIPEAVVDINEKMYDIVKKLDNLNVWNLPVVNKGKYLGFISKANVLSHYRNLLVSQTKRE